MMMLMLRFIMIMLLLIIKMINMLILVDYYANDVNESVCNESDDNEFDYIHDDDDADDTVVNATDNAGVGDADANICANDDANDYVNHNIFVNDDH